MEIPNLSMESLIVAKSFEYFDLAVCAGIRNAIAVYMSNLIPDTNLHLLSILHSTLPHDNLTCPSPLLIPNLLNLIRGTTPASTNTLATITAQC